MNYRKFGNTGVSVSALGFGCMRFPTREDGTIDRARATAMLRDAIDQGLNYVDTAYGYHNGESESAVGEALLDGYREKVNLATKMPLWKVEKPEDFDTIFAEQLTRLQTDHVDFYLLHSLNRDTWENKVLKFGLIEKIQQAKADGRAKHIGFSFHDDFDTFKEIVDTYKGCEFCQIQYNYIDTDHQATQQGLDYAAAKGLGVIVMEPLLGGKLASPPKMVAGVLSEEKTPVEWALDFIWNQPGVSLLLSGMSTEQQAADNLAYASRSSVGMLDAAALAMFAEAKRIYDKMPLVPCTHCEYCMPCPFGVNIPETFVCYNKTVSQGMKSAAADYAALQGKAELCRVCRRCESLCPQHIKISEEMPAIRKLFAEYRPEADD